MGIIHGGDEGEKQSLPWTFFSSLSHSPNALCNIHGAMAPNPAAFHLITNLRKNEDARGTFPESIL